MTGWCRLAASRRPSPASRRLGAGSPMPTVIESPSATKVVMPASVQPYLVRGLSLHHTQAPAPRPPGLAAKAWCTARKPVDGLGPAEAFGPGPGRGPAGLASGRPARPHPGREVLAGHAGPGVAYDFGQRGLRADYHRRAAGQRLKPGQPEGLRRSGRDGHVGAGQQRGQVGAVRQEAGEGDGQRVARRAALQPSAQRAVARHHQPGGQAVARSVASVFSERCGFFSGDSRPQCTSSDWPGAAQAARAVCRAG